MSDYGYRSSSSPEGGRFFDNSDMPEHRGNSRSNPYGDQGSYGSYGSSAGSDPRGGSAYGASNGGGWGSGGGGGSYGQPPPSNYGSGPADSGSAYGSGRPPASGGANPYGSSNGGASPYGAGGSQYGSPGSASPYGGSGSAGGGGSSYGGSAAVGGAAVGGASVPPGGPPDGEFGADHPVSGPGSARGSASVTGSRRKGVRSEDEIAAMKKQKKKKKRRKVYIAMSAVFIMFLGGITVAAAMFFQSVDLPEQLTLEETSFAYYSDGTDMGSYGQFQRKLIDEPEDVTDELEWATLALEDRSFHDHPGVDMRGVMRAVWNNISGGDTQGASTLSQQYAGQLADIRDDISYTRKASEAVIAMKMDQEMSKEEILLNYLNIAYYGRGAYGVAAASEIYFDKDYHDLDYAEAVFIMMQVQSPNGRYDPEFDGDEDEISDRWHYGMSGLVATEHLTEDERNQFDEIPTPIEFNSNEGTYGANEATGFVSHGYVYDELRDRYGISYDELYGNDGHDGGYEIHLTIDSNLQGLAEDMSDRGPLNEDGDGFENNREEAFLYQYENNMTNSLVAVEPGTGRVLAYYGGPDGTGIDKAGRENPHPPSSTFKTVTTAVAIDELGASIESWWDARSGREFDSLIDSDQEEDGITNASDSSDPPELTLEDALVDSKNTPMFAIAEDERVGASRILETAAKLGLTHMQRNDNNYIFDVDGNVTRYGTDEDEDGNLVEDDDGNIDRWVPMDPDDDGNAMPVELDHDNPRSIVDNHVSFGQYEVSVMDMSVMYATIANDGTYHEPHFIDTVIDSNGNEVDPIEELDTTQAIEPDVARDLQYVGNKITPGEGLNDGRDFFGKTGTWERDCHSDDMTPACEPGQNSHLWYIGAIPQLSVAAWVGDISDENGKLFNEQGGTDNVFGGTIAGPLWAEYMNRAIEGGDFEQESWQGPVRSGSADNGEMHTRSADRLNPDGPFCQNNSDHDPCREASDEEEEDEEDEEDEDRQEMCDVNPNFPWCDEEDEEEDNGEEEEEEDNGRGGDGRPDRNGDGDLGT